ncbi:molybdenum ABC transporter ATP-binding protein [Methylocapsa palsarum]|uniref:Molybdate transport system ATP-binding protein n=1 Tax=Methylocapsa palsarum TaxID=1612308 RepID=A0A1I3XZX8_9HYPH|nr:molybdenum ABC transporter ATP-binding protein [Methylocapsa palsarum]SFK25134.1 molybdate transport system ATP-binding protein [Methylocapsa palsarum]
MLEVNVALKVGSFQLEVAFQNQKTFTALFGQSGSGKSLTLNLISGLIRPNEGFIRLDGVTFVDINEGIFEPMHRRRVGVVFQDSNLFPHMSVRQNLLFGRWFAPKGDRRIDFDQVIEVLGIGKLLKRPPSRLSGGERQRVAIGRALLSCPRLLLFDEPMAALDMERKLEILPLIERIRDEFRVPMVYVSHAIEEVVRLADLIVVIDAGKVKAIGGPGEVFSAASAQSEEARFDRSSVLTVRVAGENARYGLTELKHSSGVIWLGGAAGPAGSEARVIIKATDVVLANEPAHRTSVRSVLQGKVLSIHDSGPFAMVEIALAGDNHLFAAATRQAVDELGLQKGCDVFALIKTAALDEAKIAPAHVS